MKLFVFTWFVNLSMSATYTMHKQKEEALITMWEQHDLPWDRIKEQGLRFMSEGDSVWKACQWQKCTDTDMSTTEGAYVMCNALRSSLTQCNRWLQFAQRWEVMTSCIGYLLYSPQMYVDQRSGEWPYSMHLYLRKPMTQAQIDPLRTTYLTSVLEI